MMFFMFHEKHGHKIAYSTNEKERDEKVGWKNVTEEQFYDRGSKKAKSQEPESPEAQVDPVRLDLIAKYEAKFGKKPHHKSSNETIEKQLAA